MSFDQVKLIDGQHIKSNYVLSFPYFVIIKDWLYWMMQDTETKEEMTQLLVPRKHHHNLMAGH